MMPPKSRLLPPSVSQLHSVAEIARRLGVCGRTVQRLVEAGLLLTHRIGRAVRISEEDLQRYLQGARG
jgi:excisionase family DNA binding protein